MEGLFWSSLHFKESIVFDYNVHCHNSILGIMYIFISILFHAIK